VSGVSKRGQAPAELLKNTMILRAGVQISPLFAVILGPVSIRTGGLEREGWG
jgi:hypothetical protein